MATVQPFTPRTLDNLKDGALADPITPGLTIDAAGGVKTWRYKRKVQGTAFVFKKVLGTFPKVNIADARTAARAFNVMVEAGVDPRADAKAQAAAGMTVAEAHTLYMAYVRSGERKVLKTRTIQEKVEIYTRDMVSLHSKPIHTITDDDLWEIVETKGETATTRANRLGAEMKVFFSWCASRRGKKAGVGLADDPSRTLSGSYFAQKHRTRFLSDNELSLFLQALAHEGRIYQRALGLLLLTATRRNEVLEGKLAEFEDGVWSIPGARTKNSLTHRVPLAKWGRFLIGGTNSEWLIASPRLDNGPMTAGWPKVIERIRLKMEELGGCDVEHFTPHDLRRTFRSNTTRLKIPLEVAEACLNHKKRGLVEIYDGYDMLDEKRDAFAVWEAKLIDIATKAGIADKLGMPSPQGA